MKLRLLTISAIIAALLLSIFSPNINPAKAAGAFFYLSPSTGTKMIDSVFAVTIKVNTGEAVINAAEGTLNFDSGKIAVTEISKSGSIFNLWTADPSFDNSKGVINFGGGIPRPGYNGKSGTVVTVSFKAKAAGDAQLFFSSGAILANDGLGTNILTSMGSANYTIAPKSDAPKDETPETKTPGKEDIKDAGETEDATKQNFDLTNKLGIISPSHPDESVWYGENTAEFKWNLPPEAEQVSFDLNNDPNFDPEAKKQGLLTSKKFENIKDGVWYFHLKIKIGKNWSEVSRYRLQIDTTPPAPFKIYVDQKEASDLPILFFKTVDAASGVVRYEVNIGSLEEKAFVVDSSEEALKIPSLEIGPHTAMVKAIDMAGNEVISTINFNIIPIETPVIKNFSQEIQPDDKLFMSGTALSDVNLTIYIQKDEGKVITKRTSSDRNGLWYFINDESLENGRYVAWVEAVNAHGLKSEPTAKVSFLVTPPVFTRIGSVVINYFTIFTSLIFLIILIILSTTYLIGLARKRLKKETFEVEDALHSSIEGIRQMVDEEFAKIGKMDQAQIAKEKSKLKSTLKRKIDSAEKRVMKEVKDVENLLD